MRLDCETLKKRNDGIKGKSGCLKVPPFIPWHSAVTSALIIWRQPREGLFSLLARERMSVSSPFFFFFSLLCASPKIPLLLALFLSSPPPLLFVLTYKDAPCPPLAHRCKASASKHEWKRINMVVFFFCLLLFFHPPQGIFPCSYIHLKNAHIKNKGLVYTHIPPSATLCYAVRSISSKLLAPFRLSRQFETVIPVEDSVITEMTSTLRDWGAMWKQLYVVSRRPKFQEIKNVLVLDCLMQRWAHFLTVEWVTHLKGEKMHHGICQLKMNKSKFSVFEAQWYFALYWNDSQNTEKMDEIQPYYDSLTIRIMSLNSTGWIEKLNGLLLDFVCLRPV